MATFKYEPLRTPSSIRLVSLQPRYDGDSIDKIHIELKEFGLSEVSKKYYALSYVWGEGGRTETISVNGLDFYVTENLMFFLRRRRPFSNPLRYWIDAICINQSDMDEKAQQIPRMAEIYENASLVHAELGPATMEEESVIENMKFLSKFMLNEIKRVRTENNGTLKLSEVRLPEKFVQRYDPTVWNNIGAFFGRPWWERAWVMQEATALRPNHTLLFYGQSCLTMTEVWGTDVGLNRLVRLKPWGDDPEPTTRQYRIRRISDIQSFRRRGESDLCWKYWTNFEVCKSPTGEMLSTRH